jgi:hypothetical protein
VVELGPLPAERGWHKLVREHTVCCQHTTCTEEHGQAQEVLAATDHEWHAAVLRQRPNTGHTRLPARASSPSMWRVSAQLLGVLPTRDGAH